MVDDSGETEENASLGDMRDDERSSASAESEAARAGEDAGPSPRRPYSSAERRSFGNLWLISYADFMTIMMIFFLALYGYTVMAKAALAKTKQATYSEFAEMISKIKGPLGESIHVQEDRGKVVLQMPDKILFSSGQAALNQNAKRTLEDVASSLKLVDGEVVVEGHTDNVPVKGGRYKSNWELSAARSFSVIEALSQQGVPQERLAAWGFGDTRSIGSNETVEGRAKNRRIEIVLLKKTVNK